ncbi:MAG: hypothetical protein ACKV2U_24050 [Bryobacteraceae bacterium]
MPSPLAQLLTDRVIRRMAGTQVYRRGRDYYMHGHVESVRNHGTGIRAVVRGQFDYNVTLIVTDGAIEYECSCSMGESSEFCKHCVAAALAFVHGGALDTPPKKVTLDDAAKLLAKEPSAALAKMLLDWSRDDALLRGRLLQYTARRAGPEHVIAAARAAFENAAIPRRYIDYRGVAAFTQSVNRAIDAFDEILADGHAAPLVDLCEAAVRTLAKGAEMVHDDGEIASLAARLAGIHLQACRQARPDPVKLATRLFHLEIDESITGFSRAAETYAEVIGITGLFAYKLLAEAPAFAKHYPTASILESVARADGNVDWLVAILQRDLSHACRYTEIANAYLQNNRHDEGLAWAEKGLKAFPADVPLREIAANEHHRRGHHADAMKLIWAAYMEAPGLQLYKTLRHHATLAADWPEWRDNALGLIRQRTAAAKRKADHSLLVEIFMDEDNKEEAWREAQKGGCSSSLWMTLAEGREKDHPGDAAPIYLRQVDEQINRTRNSDYSGPVELLIRTAAVMKRIGASPEFARQLDLLRFKYKIKRNFIKLLDKHRRQLLEP